MNMKVVSTLALLVLLAALVSSQGQNRKKFGSNQKSNPDYDPPPEDYDQDALYYEDYDEQGAKKDKSKDTKEGATAGATGTGSEAPSKGKTTTKPALRPIALARPTPKAKESHDDHKGGAAPSLFIPRRNRTPFTPRPADKPKPTLPSFIRNPVNPGLITTPKPFAARASIADRPPVTAKTSSVIRATTARPSRFKNGPSTSSRDRTTASPTDTDSGNRKYGGSTGTRPGSKLQRGGYRSGSGSTGSAATQ